MKHLLVTSPVRSYNGHEPIRAIQHRFRIIKTDISGYFPIVMEKSNTCEKGKPEDKAKFINKRIYGEEQIEFIKHELSQIE